MKSWGAAAAAGLLVLGLAACDEDRQAAGAASKISSLKPAPPPGTVSHPPLSVASDAQRSKAIAAQTRQLAMAGRTTGDVTVDKSKLDWLFERRHTPTQSGLGVTPVSAPSAEEMRRKALTLQTGLVGRHNTPLRRSGSGDQPQGETLPTVPLPDPSAAAGDANVRGGGAALVAFDAFLQQAYHATGKVFSREAWHANASASRQSHQNPTRVTIHHTDGRQTFTVADTLKAVKNIQDFHQGPERGWGDIGYHFLVDGGGNVVEGRHADVLGAHVYGHNTNNLGIANLGDYNRDNLTDAQKDALKRLISFLALKYKTDPRQKGFIEGHHHFQGNETDCPGPHIDAFLPELRRLVEQNTVDIVSRVGPGTFLPMLVSTDGASA